VPFVFDTLDTARDLVSDGAPTDLAASIHSSWVGFASTGDPNGGDLPDWPRYDTSTRAVMDFGATRAVLHDPDSAQRRLWDAKSRRKGRHVSRPRVLGQSMVERRGVSGR